MAESWQKFLTLPFNLQAFKLNWLPQQRPLGYHKTYVSFVIHLHVTSYAERLVKIGPVVVEIFAGICQFLPSRPKRFSVTLSVSWVTGPILIIFAHNVARILPLNILKSELPYS